MPDLLIELFSEEIPARMQQAATDHLKKAVTDALVDNGLTYEGAAHYVTPRRLTLDVRGVEASSKPVREERKGPRTDAPEKAIEGFLRAAGLDNVAQASVQNDPKKGDFYVAISEKPGRAAEEIIAEFMPAIIKNFPWPKSMRWGAQSAQAGALKWVRPLQSILCTFGPETEEPVVAEFEIGGITSSNMTYGHRFHAPDAIKVRRFDDYAASLEKAFVVLDAARRREIILEDARNLAFANGLELVEDEGLLHEVAGLVEWPQVLMGNFEQEFLQIPDEMTRLTIKTNQKCFVTRGKDGALSNQFILVANIAAKDGGKEIAHGNGKVVRARLSDALYFWQTDQRDLPDVKMLGESAVKFGLYLKKPLDQRMARLDQLGVTFHAKLGSQGERVLRIAKLAEELAPIVGADPALARRAATLAKADLQTEAVGEFPELQGLMGRKYAELQGEHESVCAAIEDHYKPQGPTDTVPKDPVAIAVALADKLDTLVGFWAIDEKPTGSKDPYALRRAALGVIRIILERGIKVDFHNLFEEIYLKVLLDTQSKSFVLYGKQYGSDGFIDIALSARLIAIKNGPEFRFDRHSKFYFDTDQVSEVGIENYRADLDGISDENAYPAIQTLVSDLLSFFHDRLKTYLRDQGARHDLIDAVVTPESDDLLDIARRVEQLTVFLDSEDGKNLVAGTKRAANIIAAEEKKGGTIADSINADLLALDEEKALYQAILKAEPAAAEASAKGDYGLAMASLADLRAPVDAFLDNVLVNDEDATIRTNRLALLKRIADATGRVADFSKIAG